MTTHRLCALLAALAGTAAPVGIRAATPFGEDFATNPVAERRFAETTTDTESAFTYNANGQNLTALVDVDASPAFYLSNPFAPLTDADDLSFSVEFRVTSFDERAAPTAFLGLMTTNHVEAFGDGLTMVVSIADGIAVANANVDAREFRSAGGTIELDLNLPYRAMGRFHPGRREFSVAIFTGTGFTNLLQISTAKLPADRSFRVDRLGVQNGGGELVDQSVGSISLVADEFRIPARGRPLASIGSSRVSEGDVGSRTVLLPVDLAFPTDQIVTINYATVDGSASANLDYRPVSGTVTFLPGEVAKTVAFEVLGDNVKEPDEVFGIRLSSPVNAVADAAEGVITIANDDGVSGKLDHFEWGLIPSPQGVGQAFDVTITAKDASQETITDFTERVALRPSSIGTEQSIGGGGASVSWNRPLASAAQDARTQVLYPAAELGGPGRITDLSLFITTPPGRKLTNWTLRIKPTPLSVYPGAPVWESSGWTTVYRANETLSTSGWTRFTFANPFEYDGSSSLLIDFSFDTGGVGRDGASRATETGRSRSLSFTSSSANGSPLTWAGRNPLPVASTRVPELRLGIQRPIRITPPFSDPFVGGSWHGQITVLNPATNMVVEADDGQTHFGRSLPFTVGILGDLAVGLAHSPSSIRVGQSFAYQVSVTNLGLLPATGVVLEDRLPTDAKFVGASGPRGTCALTGRDVVCDLGILDAGAVATFEITMNASAQGTLTNRARVTAVEADPDPANNLAVLATTILPPLLGIQDVTVVEGDGGRVEAVFTVRVSLADREVRVDFTTVDGTARAGQDYQRTSGTLFLPLGVTSATLSVPILGDSVPEDLKRFTVTLANPVNAVLFNASATGTILDDDASAAPCLSVSDVVVVEGDAGLTNATFVVALSHASGQVISVDYATADVTAASGSDFQASQRSLSFPIGTTTATVDVAVFSDRGIEADEAFRVRFLNPGNAGFCGGLGEWLATGTILNDDGLPGKLDHFAWGPIPSPQATNQPFAVRLTAQDVFNQTVEGFTDRVSIRATNLVTLEHPAGNLGTRVAWNHPLAAAAQDARTQVIYPASELGGPGRLTALALFVNSSASRRLTNWTLRIKPTTLTSYSASPAWENSGWVTVYRAHTSFTGGAWNTLTFGTPYEYDGTRGLLIDFSFNTASSGADVTCRATETGRARSLTFVSNSANGDPLSWAARNPVPVASTRVPELKLTVQRPVRLSPTESAPFVDGVWQGEISVGEPGTNIVLQADDGNLHTGSSNPFDVGVIGDLAVGLRSTPITVRPGQLLTYQISVTNLGLVDATGVVVSDRLPGEVGFLSALGPRGACQFDGRDVSCELGALAAGATAEFSLTVTALAQGSITNRARVVASEADPEPANNLVSLVSLVTPPVLSLRGQSVVEGNGEPSDAVFEVRLSPADREVRVAYRTSDVTAIAGRDYVHTNGVLVFPLGVTTNYVHVPILGDVLPEDAETFTVTLLDPVNAGLFAATSTGTILDDDLETRPCLSVSDAIVTEGDSGATNATFLLTLSQASGQTVSVDYRTVDGSARAGSDYGANAGTIRFPPGTTSASVTVAITGDRLAEADETFALRLVDPVNATFCGGAIELSGDCLLVNDDALAGKLDHFGWAIIPSPQGTNRPFAVTLTAQDSFNRTVTGFTNTVQLLPSVIAVDRPVSAGGTAVSWKYPLGSVAHDARTEVIYLASELGGPCRIKALSLYVESAPGRRLTNWTIRLRTTPLSRYPATPSWSTGGWSTARRANDAFSSTGWVTFVFTAPFDYDGTSNLLVDFSFNTALAGRDGFCRATETGVPRSLTFASNSGNGDPLSWAARNPIPVLSTRVPMLRLAVERPAAVVPSVSGAFVDGTWQGEVTVQEAVNNLVLVADDGQLHTGTSNPFNVGVLGDLSVGLTSSPAVVRVGQSFSYQVTVTNLGLAPATGVILTDRLPAEVRFTSATGPGGPCTFDGRDVSCVVDLLGPGASTAFDLAVIAGAQGAITNRARVVAVEDDPDLASNLATLVRLVDPPTLAIQDASVTEGDGGAGDAVFAVILSAADREVRISYSTAEGTARAGQDFLPAANTLVFPVGVLTNYIRVPIVGDTVPEDTETFTVILSNPVNASFAPGTPTITATGRVLDDDRGSLPCLSAADVTVTEGDSSDAIATVALTLSRPSGQVVTFRYTTADRTAIAGSDYTATQGILRFDPGVTNLTVDVRIPSDRLPEPVETFELRLSDGVNATACMGPTGAAATVTVLDPDGAPGHLDHFEWAMIPSPQGISQPFNVTVSAKDALHQTVPGFSGSASLVASAIPYEQALGGTGGTVTWNFPVAAAAHDARTQIIYPASELGGAGRITSLSLFATTSPGRQLNGWTIRLKPTPLRVYPASPGWEASGWTTVYRGNEAWVAGGLRTFRFSTPFDYAGVDNLLIDLSFNTAATGRDGACRATDTGSSRSLSFTSNSANGDPLAWTGRNPVPVVSTRVPQILLNVERPIRISPTVASPFVDGMWQGQISVLEAATNLVLRADDGQTHVGDSNPFNVGILGDLVVGVAATPASVRVGQPLTYTLSVTNLGLTAGTGVIVSDRLPSEVRFLSATGSRGSCALLGRDVTCDLGMLEAGATASFDIAVIAVAQGSITNRGRVTANEPDPQPANNLAVLVTTVTPPAIAIRDVSLAEGDGEPVEAVFTVRLSASGREVQVDFTTADGGARAGQDYVATRGTLVIPADTETAFIRVPVLGDTLPEGVEDFTVTLSHPVNAAIFDGTATATLEDDDLPGLAVQPAAVQEGDQGTTFATFNVTLFPARAEVVSVSFATVDGTATAAADYVPATSLVSFAPGTTNQIVRVGILGDSIHEADETFRLNLSGAIGATIAKPSAVGTILNDDFADLVISDTLVNVGIPGTSNAVVRVTLSYPSLQPIDVDYATVDGTATAGTDYEAQAATLRIPAGASTAAILIPISSNTIDETNEVFHVVVSRASHARVVDGDGLVTIVNSAIARNEPPTISPISSRVMLEDGSPLISAFMIGDRETPVADLRVVVTSLDKGLFPDERLVLGGSGADRTLQCQPAADQFGAASLVVTVTDGEGLTATAAVEVEVRPVNDPPTLAPIADRTLDEDGGPLAVDLTGVGSGAANERQGLRISARSDPPELLPEPAVAYTSPGTTGLLTLTPRPEAHGSAIITVTVQDDGGTADGGRDAVTNRFRVTVRPGVTPPGNLPPTVAISTPTDHSSYPPWATIPISVNATDRDGTVGLVELFAGSLRLTQWTSPPYVFAWDGVAVGNYVLTARATDDDGATTTSSPVRIVLSELSGEVAIVRNGEDPEIAVLENVLFDMGLSSHVFDQEGLTFEALQRFHLVIWDDLGRTGLTEATVGILHRIHTFGLPLYLMGDHLATVGAGLPPATRAKWDELLHARSAGGVSRANESIVVNSINEPHCIINGRFGAIADYAHTNRFDLVTAAADAEVYGRVTGGDVLVGYPPYVEADANFELVRLFSQHGRLNTGAEGASRQERKELFQNIVTWLLKRCRPCNTLALVLEINGPTEPLSAGAPASFELLVRQSGECEGLEVVITNRLPANVVFVRADSKRGQITFEGGVITFNLGHLVSAEIAELGFTVIPTAPGEVIVGAGVHALNALYDEATDLVWSTNQVTGGAVLTLETPSTGQYRLRLQGNDRTPYEIQASTNMLNWTVMTNTAGGIWSMPLLDPVQGRLGRRFYRARER